MATTTSSVPFPGGDLDTHDTSPPPLPPWLKGWCRCCCCCRLFAVYCCLLEIFLLTSSRFLSSTQVSSSPPAALETCAARAKRSSSKSPTLPAPPSPAPFPSLLYERGPPKTPQTTFLPTTTTTTTTFAKKPSITLSLILASRPPRHSPSFAAGCATTCGSGWATTSTCLRPWLARWGTLYKLKSVETHNSACLKAPGFFQPF
jgi:hypothetical protein